MARASRAQIAQCWCASCGCRSTSKWTFVREFCGLGALPFIVLCRTCVYAFQQLALDDATERVALFKALTARAILDGVRYCATPYRFAPPHECGAPRAHVVSNEAFDAPLFMDVARDILEREASSPPFSIEPAAAQNGDPASVPRREALGALVRAASNAAAQDALGAATALLEVAGGARAPTRAEVRDARRRWFALVRAALPDDALDAFSRAVLAAAPLEAPARAAVAALPLHACEADARAALGAFGAPNEDAALARTAKHAHPLDAQLAILVRAPPHLVAAPSALWIGDDGALRVFYGARGAQSAAQCVASGAMERRALLRSYVELQTLLAECGLALQQPYRLDGAYVVPHATLPAHCSLVVEHTHLYVRGGDDGDALVHPETLRRLALHVLCDDDACRFEDALSGAVGAWLAACQRPMPCGDVFRHELFAFSFEVNTPSRHYIAHQVLHV
jgi:hypothetical protein